MWQQGAFPADSAASLAESHGKCPTEQMLVPAWGPVWLCNLCLGFAGLAIGLSHWATADLSSGLNSPSLAPGWGVKVFIWHFWVFDGSVASTAERTFVGEAESPVGL